MGPLAAMWAAMIIVTQLVSLDKLQIQGDMMSSNGRTTLAAHTAGSIAMLPNITDTTFSDANLNTDSAGASILLQMRKCKEVRKKGKYALQIQVEKDSR